MIPGWNDSDDELGRLSGWLVEHVGPDVPVHFSAFHPDFKIRDLPRTPPETLRRARQIARAAGLRHVYTGNVHDLDGDATRCPGCDAVVIQRDWYELLRWDLVDGACGQCGETIAGVFEARPGTWGSRRRRVHIA